MIEKITISFALEDLDEEKAQTLSSFFDEVEGNVPLYMKVIGRDYAIPLDLKTEKKICVNRKLLEFLKSWEGANFKIN
mgnify:CR=1 FL=1